MLSHGYNIRDKVSIYDALLDLTPFVQFKKREKDPWRSVTYSKVAGVTEIHRSENVSICFREISSSITGKVYFFDLPAP